MTPGTETQTPEENAGYVTGTSPDIEIGGKLQDYLDAGMIPGAPIQGEGTSLILDQGYIEENLEPLATDFVGTDRGAAA